MQLTPRIAPCLWFDDQAEAAAAFYTSIFKNSRIVDVSRYGEAGREVHGKPGAGIRRRSSAAGSRTGTACRGRSFPAC
jgi:hypothetical protein